MVVVFVVGLKGKNVCLGGVRFWAPGGGGGVGGGGVTIAYRDMALPLEMPIGLSRCKNTGLYPCHCEAVSACISLTQLLGNVTLV